MARGWRFGICGGMWYTGPMKRLAEVTPRVERLLAAILPRRAGAFAVGDLPPPVAALTAMALGEGRTLLVAPSPEAAEQAAADAVALAPRTPVLSLAPADDEQAALTGERVAQVRAILGARGRHCLIVASIHALWQPIPEPGALEAASRTLRVGEDTPFDTLAETLTRAGYTREEMVADPLTFALRGGILDVWPAGAERPARVEFFGDTVDGIRVFDPATQCSVAKVEAVTVPPAPSAALRTTRLLPMLRDAAAVVWDAPAVEQALAQLPLADAAAGTNAAWFAAEMGRFGGRVCWAGEPLRGGVPGVALVARPIRGVRDLAGDGGTHHPDFYVGLRRQLLGELDAEARKRGHTVAICAETAAARELLAHDLPPDSPVALLPEGLSQGFAVANLNLTVAAQSDLYPTTRAWRAPARRRAVAGQRLEYAFDVEPGELVVHLEHGIGRFLGLTEVEVNGRRTEVFTLEYANGAKLHVPTTHAHLLSRYIGPGGHKVRLHSLDGTRWRGERAAAQRGIEDLAAGLLETQARRRVIPGFAFDLSDPWIAEFEALFPWQETPDQTRVIAEVKQDLAAPMAMDRLLCGDAGYGKTEVAMRAAFIAVANHKQVALLTPTTVLAEQHYATFCERMAHFPVRIEVLSRFRSPGCRAKTCADAAAGRVDILIGTHALLSEQVAFRDLGLLIVDEEQRFGVAHKERLKRLRAVVDVLTMSATPIPRTLYLSLTGARDLSLLRTPPSNRVAVETLIRQDDDDTLLAAIRNELARGGQVFYLYNRVRTIGRVHERLRRLVPEARILVAHGQMPAETLARTMRAFAEGEADLLLCTTIVESGIDIPRANTILIDRADRFGLADLYQLRGRVGRSSAKGFAYLLLPRDGYVDGDGRKRLQALKRHSGLGAGYAIALRDLEIRGSGNLLGAAQSGHIAAIGFGLYCQLLRRTIARMKGESLPTLVDTEVLLDFLDPSPGATGPSAAAIPYGYIDDEAQRMNAYRRLAEAVSPQEIQALRDELADRYGPLPPPAVRTLRLAGLRILAADRALAKVEVSDGRLTCYDRRNRVPLKGLRDRPLPEGLRPDDALAWVERQIAGLPAHRG